MTRNRDWNLLPFIIVAGLLVGWISGQIVRVLTSADVVVTDRPKPTPR